MTKKITVSTVLLFIFCVSFIKAQKQKAFSTAGFYEVANSPRNVYHFNPGWRFFKGNIAGAEKVSFDDSKWEAANLPHGLEVLGENASGGRNYQGIAWYRKQFKIKPHSHNGKIYMYFEAVMGKCKVWLNGKQVAEHFGGYLPFAIDITPYLNKDGDNIVAVKADNSNDKSYLPGKIQEGLDFAYFGGIYRDTYLIETSNIHVSLTALSKTVAGGGIFVATTNINGDNAQLEVRTELKNDSHKRQTITLRTTIEDANFKALKSATQKLQLKAQGTRQLAQKINLKHVHFWHPDDPYLHFVKTELLVDGKVVDAMRTRTGIRLFEMRGPDGLYINKKPYTAKIIGVNRHQDYAYIGNALPNSGQYRDVKLLREGGSRIIRVAHYPQDPAFYDACDELGMLTTTANPGWHFFNFKNPIFEKRLYEDTRQLVRRDRNVASILMWETALNETPQQPDDAMHNMHVIAHKEYPFPGFYTVTDYQEAKKGGLDIYYHGNDPKVNSFNREYGDGDEVDNWYSQNSMSRVKMEWGEKALLTQAMRQAKILDARYTTPKVCLGGAKWAGIDHQRGYHPDPFLGGLLNIFRLPKYVYFLYKSQYDADYKVPGIKTGPMVFTCNELTQVSPKDVVIFSNCDEVKLTWLGKVIATQKPSRDPQFADMPHPPFIFKNVFNFDIIKNSEWRKKTNKIKMIAEGIINNKVVVTDVKDYPERTASIKLKVDNQNLNLVADGSDIIPIRATVVDVDGTKKVLASQYVYFKVTGPAEIIGNESTHANPVKTEFGVATLLIRASTKAGEISIKAYSNGLASDEIKLKSVPASFKMLYDKDYMKASKKSNPSQKIIIQKAGDKLPADVTELRKEVKRLRIDIVGKEQDIMELRSRLK